MLIVSLGLEPVGLVVNTGRLRCFGCLSDVCRSHHLVNAHEVNPVQSIQSLCAVCGSNLAGLSVLYIVLPCMVAVVSRPAWRMFVFLIARYVSNLINEHYYYYYWTC